MNPWDASRLADELMARHGLVGWTFAFNRRKAALGLCRYDSRRIELSIYFVMRNHEPAVRDTILHEIAHALAGPRAGHGPTWKQVCRQIGALPERVDTQADMPRGRWRGTCNHCGKVFARHRRPAVNAIYSCPDCGRERGRVQFRYMAAPT